MATPTIVLRQCAARLLAAGAAVCALMQACYADPAVANPVGGGESVRLEPVLPTAAARRTPRPVYVCHDATPVIFSDRPCGPVVERRAVDVVQPGPGQAATTVRAAPTAATRPRIHPAPADPRPAPDDGRCTRLRDQLEKLDDRMRSGYSAREAARLWNRWREAKARVREARC